MNHPFGFIFGKPGSGLRREGMKKRKRGLKVQEVDL